MKHHANQPQRSIKAANGIGPGQGVKDMLLARARKEQSRYRRAFVAGFKMAEAIYRKEEAK